MPVVTVDGQIGSGALEVGAQVARNLQFDYVDQLILAEAAKRLGTSIDTVAEREQATDDFWNRLGRLLRRALERSAYSSAGSDPFYGMGIDAVLLEPYLEDFHVATDKQTLTDRNLAEVIHDVVKDLAKGGNSVIVGRGSNMILRHTPKTFHIATVASNNFRVKTIANRENVDTNTASRIVNLREKARRSYFGRHFKVDPDDPNLYHLILNPELLGIKNSALIVTSALHELAW